MKIKKNGEIINLTESDLRRIKKVVINEQIMDPMIGEIKKSPFHNVFDKENPKKSYDDVIKYCKRVRFRKQLKSDDIFNPFKDKSLCAKSLWESWAKSKVLFEVISRKGVSDFYWDTNWDEFFKKEGDWEDDELDIGL